MPRRFVVVKCDVNVSVPLLLSHLAHPVQQAPLRQSNHPSHNPRGDHYSLGGPNQDKRFRSVSADNVIDVLLVQMVSKSPGWK